MMTASRMGRGREFDLIRAMLENPPGAGSDAAPLPDGVRLGPGDDCAMVVGEGIVLSSDLSIEGVHFRRDWLTIEEIGYRAAAAALSDLAAVAARPMGILVSLALPRAEAGRLVPALRTGLVDACRLTGAALLGGDLVRAADGLVLDVVAVGEAARPILRSGARPGDVLWVTGRLGGSAAAVRAWERGDRPAAGAREAFSRPLPRTAEALWLSSRAGLHALIDLSDGLAGDAGHLAAAGAVHIVIDADAVPIHPAAEDSAPRSTRDGADGRSGDRTPSLLEDGGPETGAEAAIAGTPLELALLGGEDFELCFAATADEIEPLRADFEARFGIPLTAVGRVEAAGPGRGEGGGVFIALEGMPRIEFAGAAFDHFDAEEHPA